MKILHVIGSLAPGGGGPPVVVARLAGAQAAVGHDVTIASCDQEKSAHTSAAELLASGEGGDRVALVFTRAGRMAWPSGDGDTLLHVHGVWEPFLWNAAAAARRAGVPYLVTPHGMLDPWCLRQKHLKKRIALALWARAMLNGADALHALTERERAGWCALRLRTPVWVIANGVDSVESELARPNAARQGTDDATSAGVLPARYVLYLGRLHAKKRVGLLVEAFARYVETSGDAETSLVIAGPDDGTRAEAESLGRARLGDRLRFVGPVWGDAKWRLLRGASCVALPSVQEGMSVAVLEALACGVPAVASEAAAVGGADAGVLVVSDSTDHAVRGDATWTDRDVAAWSDSLQRLLADAALHATLGRAARAAAVSRFDWRTIASEMCAAYQSSLGSRRSVD